MMRMNLEHKSLIDLKVLIITSRDATEKELVSQLLTRYPRNADCIEIADLI